MKTIKTVRFFFGVALGSMVTYFFDNSRGKARRSVIQDQFRHYFLRTRTYLFRFRRGLFYKSVGLISEFRARVKNESYLLDDVLEARVRSRLGRTASQPHSIKVVVHDGHITLQGKALPYEIPEIFDSVKTTRGVKSIDNQLQSPHIRAPKPGVAA